MTKCVSRTVLTRQLTPLSGTSKQRCCGVLSKWADGTLNRLSSLNTKPEQTTCLLDLTTHV